MKPILLILFLSLLLTADGQRNSTTVKDNKTPADTIYIPSDLLRSPWGFGFIIPSQTDGKITPHWLGGNSPTKWVSGEHNFPGGQL